MANRKKYDGVIVENPEVTISKMVNERLFNPYHKNLDVNILHDSIALVCDYGSYSWKIFITEDQIILTGTVNEFYDFDRVYELKCHVGSIRSVWNVWKSLRKSDL